MNVDAVDREGKFIWRNGEVVFGFGGKHRGKPLREVVVMDRGYINWMIEKGSFNADVIPILTKSSLLPLVVMEPTEAGCESTRFSATSAAAVTCTIMNPD